MEIATNGEQRVTTGVKLGGFVKLAAALAFCFCDLFRYPYFLQALLRRNEKGLPLFSFRKIELRLPLT